MAARGRCLHLWRHGQVNDLVLVQVLLDCTYEGGLHAEYTAVATNPAGLMQTTRRADSDPALPLRTRGEEARRAAGVATIHRLPGKHFLQEDREPALGTPDRRTEPVRPIPGQRRLLPGGRLRRWLATPPIVGPARARLSLLGVIPGC
jgi:hypothetical protein